MGREGRGGSQLWEQAKTRKNQLDEPQDFVLLLTRPMCVTPQTGLFRDRPADYGELRPLALLLLLLLPTATAHLPLHRLCPGHLCHHRGSVGPVRHSKTPADESRWVGRLRNPHRCLNLEPDGLHPRPKGLQFGDSPPNPDLCVEPTGQHGFSQRNSPFPAVPVEGL